MRRDRSVDVSLVVGAVLASVVFVTGLAAVSGFAAKATESPITRSASQGASPESAGHSGFRLEMDLHAGAVVPDGWVEYLVYYENLGAITEPVHITDTLPLWSNFGGAWWGEGDQPNAGEPLTGTVVMDDKVAWDLGQLEGRGARWFHVQMWLAPDLQVGQTITNTTEIVPASFETSLDDNFGIAADVLNDLGPNLAVSKGHEWSLPEYGQLAYSIRFANLGSQGVRGVFITDTFPVDTHWDGWWETEFPNVSLVMTNAGPETAVWYVEGMNAGEVGWLLFNTDLDQPGVPLQFFTNTVQIESQASDVDPGDNQYEDVAFSGNSITEVHLWAETEHSSVWGFAHEYAAITGTIQLEVGDQTLEAEWDLTCGGCWEFPDVGPILAGNTITVTAGTGIPVVIEVPTPITAAADSDTDLVWGQIDHLDGESVEVELYEVGTRLVTTDNKGNFVASFPDVPHGGQGEVRYSTEIDWANVVFHRQIDNPDIPPRIAIQKTTNGYDADAPPGPYIPVGEPVTWTYTITNTGHIPLTTVTVEDNQPGVTPDCQPFDLQPGETVVCTANGVAVEGQHGNVGTATGMPPGGNDPVIADDASHYFGMSSSIAIRKLTNGEDADAPPGPYIPVGEPVTWTYAITNTGNITLTAVTVEDNQPGVVPDCPGNVLGPGQAMACTASGVAVVGQYQNIGIANGSPPAGDPVGDSDLSHYFGLLAGPIFEDGFESGDTSAWSRTVP